MEAAAATSSRWWQEVEELPCLTLEDLRRLCGAFADPQHRRAAVVRGILSSEWTGWMGRLCKLDPDGRRFSLYHAAHQWQNAFSRTVHTATHVRSGFNLWMTCKGIIDRGRSFQLRAYTDLAQQDLLELLGPELGEALREGTFALQSATIWSGSPASRTPLHKDHVPGLIFQAVGTKRFFLCSQAEIDEAVACGLLPEAVRDDGSTECFCVDGLLDSVYGIDAATPTRSHGTLAVLSAGDCLILPQGLYHDVECAIDGPALSLTLRFEL
eukprot:TRINITY_DN112984_c0_g1_i1.p1 TRINITY_DN112984_c0_g1~~TRINITY_DN112984_c0_g1_i1.p1  ORF type:complete len:269 (+),score=49.30 TRINITY_DN112984_c0_g1_i1:30-836(+)